MSAAHSTCRVTGRTPTYRTPHGYAVWDPATSRTEVFLRCLHKVGTADTRDAARDMLHEATRAAAQENRLLAREDPFEPPSLKVPKAWLAVTASAFHAFAHECQAPHSRGDLAAWILNIHDALRTVLAEHQAQRHRAMDEAMNAARNAIHRGPRAG